MPSTDFNLEGSGSGDAGQDIWKPAMQRYLDGIPRTGFKNPPAKIERGKIIDVPRVFGLGIRAATKKFEKEGFNVVSSYVYSDAPEGTFLGYSPSPGSRAPQYSTIFALYSKGRDPDVVAAERAEARAEEPRLRRPSERPEPKPEPRPGRGRAEARRRPRPKKRGSRGGSAEEAEEAEEEDEAVAQASLPERHPAPLSLSRPRRPEPVEGASAQLSPHLSSNRAAVGLALGLRADHRHHLADARWDRARRHRSGRSRRRRSG